MRARHLIPSLAASLLFLGACPLLPAIDGPATQPAANEPAVAPAATQPAGDAPATQPVDLKAAADERHRHMDERLRQLYETQRTNLKSRWIDAPIAQTFKPGALINLSLDNGQLKVESTDLSTAVPVRVAVEGSKDVWMLGRPRPLLAGGGVAAGASYLNLTCYDFDAKDETPWMSRLFSNDRSLSLTAQNQYGITSLAQANGMLNLRVSEFTQLGQPTKVIVADQAPTLLQLRAEHPEEFRMYVIPLLSRFSDSSFLQPGAADVYGVFAEIPADQKILQDVQQLIPQLDADDPADREAASAKLRQLAAPGVLAAMRLDESTFSEEQKIRLKSFVAGFRRLPSADAKSQRHSLSFLIDCLEYADPAVRSAAKAELESQTHQTINFDVAQSPDAAGKAADALRKQLLTTAPPAQPAAPATQPTPQA